MTIVAADQPPAAPEGRFEGATSYLHPGRFTVSAEPTLVTTILGSCVSLCLWDGASGIGGINHFLLPESLSATRSPRFARPACEDLLERLLALGARRTSLRGKLFGGAALSGGAAGSIGSRNVDAARQFVVEAAIPLVAEDVGGGRGRKLLFETASGAAWVRLLRCGE